VSTSLPPRENPTDPPPLEPHTAPPVALVTPDPWEALRPYTPARIALGRSGSSLPTAAVLAFGSAQAQARDAVHAPLEGALLAQQLQAQGLTHLRVHSAAPDRTHYLRRPDLGRRLDAASRAKLQEQARGVPAPACVFVLADGLSAPAVAHHGVAVLACLRALWRAQAGPDPRSGDIWRTPIVIAEQARVALGDEIGELLGAQQLVMLIGERPGLSAPHSLGLYLTQAPRTGCTDAQRNCLSNVRPEGLDYPQAAWRLAGLLAGARALGRSGVDLKDEAAGLLPAIAWPATPQPLA